MIQISHESGLKIKLLNKRTIYHWLKELASVYGFSIDNLIIALVSDERILKINEDYLNHDYFTDIITFDYTEGKQINAEIFISTDRVADNSTQFETTHDRELYRVIAHGLLHCIGFKDKTDVESKKMRKAENEALALLKLM